MCSAYHWTGRLTPFNRVEAFRFALAQPRRNARPFQYMTEFQSLFADGFADLLMMHGEDVIYKKPRTGSEREIKAIVDRGTRQILNTVGDIVLPRVFINVHNDSTLGIASNEVSEAGDKVSVALKVGGSLVDRSVLKVDEQDGGVTVLALG